MQPPDYSPAWNEGDRLAALASYAILDTSPEEAFDDIVMLASQLLEAPIVAVNLIAEGRQWFKSELGLGVREMPLDDSICKVAILQQDRMVIPDTLEDPRFACNPLVTSQPGLRFYAGELLKTPDGLPLGTLCVLDTKPRSAGLTPLQEFTLKTLAQQVLTQLELRKLVHEQQNSLSENRAVLAEKIQIETALRIEQERRRLATDAARIGLWSWDRGTDSVVWDNHRPRMILGITSTDAPPSRTRFLKEFIHPDDAPGFQAAAQLTYETGTRFFFQGRAYRENGTPCWLELFGNPQYATDGTLERVTGGMVDITERKLVELDLIQSRERFQTIVSQAATGVVEADATGKITLVNQKYCEMLGYDEAELLGKSVFDVTAPDSIAATRESMQALATGVANTVIEKQYRRKDGSFIWASLSISVLRSADEKTHTMVGMVVDISENKRTEESLRELAASLSEVDRRRSEFLATLAHELRNPLAPIRSGIDLMRLQGDNPDAVAKTRDMMDRQVTQLVRLVDDLLDIARISGNKVVLQRCPVQLRDLISNSIETSKPLIDNGNHRLEVQLPDPSVRLDADPTRITQILANLLNNAAKYTPAGGLIGIATHVDGSDVVIDVTDNGIGIPAQSLSAIFEMFSQVGASLGQSQGGLGIGLSLVKRLVEMHGGSVWVTSAGAGTGSTFSVRLPMLPVQVTDMPALPAAAQTAEAARKHARVLVADDNVDAADTLSIMLDIHGHATEVAYNGHDALALIERFRPDMVFLDIGMPGMNGYETARAIRQLPGMETIALVALTGWSEQSDRDRSHAAGFDHHLTKPVDFATVEALLGDLPMRQSDSAPH